MVESVYTAVLEAAACNGLEGSNPSLSTDTTSRRNPWTAYYSNGSVKCIDGVKVS